MGPFQCKDAKLCKPSPREGISRQFTSTQLLQEHTSQEGSKAHAKCAKEQGLGAELNTLKTSAPQNQESGGASSAGNGVSPANRADLQGKRHTAR